GPPPDPPQVASGGVSYRSSEKSELIHGLGHQKCSTRSLMATHTHTPPPSSFPSPGLLPWEEPLQHAPTTWDGSVHWDSRELSTA
ncbi:hypothetical protein LEMLEM_LOCUS20754, partial [Lemmus lemmus]